MTASSTLRPAPAGVVVESHDRTGVDARRSQQLVAVLLRAGHRPFVREHGALVERMKPKPGEEPALRPDHVGPRHDVRLLVDVDRRVGVLVERAIRAPGRQRPCRPAVAIVGFVAGLFVRLVEADDVGRMAGEQALLLSRVDHVIGRRDDEREVGDRGRVIAQRSERTDVGHVTSRNRPAAGGYRDRPIVR